MVRTGWPTRAAPSPASPENLVTHHDERIEMRRWSPGLFNGHEHPACRHASQRQSVLPGANFPQPHRRSDDGLTIMRATQTVPDLDPDLAF